MAKHFADRIIEDLMQAGESWKKDVTPADVDPRQLEEGINVEFEHTRDPVISQKIALDHLAEHEGYYSALSVMEQILQRGDLDHFLEFANGFLNLRPKLRKLSKKHRARLTVV
jgi:hypothetical protein